MEVLDKAGAAFSLEPRHPFFDRRVIEYCLALPPEQKLNHGWTRVVVRHALEGILPPEIRWRGGKGDVGPNFTHGMLKWHGAQLSEFMTHGLDAIASYVDVGAVRDVYERCLATGGYDDGTLLWKVVTFARWLQRDTSAATIAGASECRLAGPRAAR